MRDPPSTAIYHSGNILLVKEARNNNSRCNKRLRILSGLCACIREVPSWGVKVGKLIVDGIIFSFQLHIEQIHLTI
jgi:hypothetical protein